MHHLAFIAKHVRSSSHFFSTAASASSLGTMASAATTTAAANKRIDQLVFEDHQKVRYLHDEFVKAPTAEMKQQLAYQMIRELSIHSSKEEEVLYPMISKVFGKEAAQHLLDEHTVLKERLAKLGNMHADKDLAAFNAQVESVMAEFNHHTKDEEESQLPKLLQAQGVDGFKMGHDFEQAAKHAVTRPHTWAPDKAPLNWVTNRMTAPLDEAADRIRFAGNPPTVNPPQ